ncbi:bifunctional DNA mismatch repair protein MutS-like [Babesia duncani]|uniref:DNA mismatch repair protein n=1 Tax=Babesia duncani TaxID=323732 RepID=A0AAD9PLQ4_9APIC|nr:bifunctional DNA mismatch repair protein MutS-like [Babesia duncani]
MASKNKSDSIKGVTITSFFKSARKNNIPEATPHTRTTIGVDSFVEAANTEYNIGTSLHAPTCNVKCAAPDPIDITKNSSSTKESYFAEIEKNTTISSVDFDNISSTTTAVGCDFDGESTNANGNKSVLFDDDDESPVCRKRSLLFDTSFKPSKLKCDEYVPPPISEKKRTTTIEEFNYEQDFNKEESGTLTVGSEPFLPPEKNADCVYDEEVKKYMNCPASQNSQCFKAYVTSFYRYSGTFHFPPWLDIRNIKDLDGHSPLDPEYNPSTLWVPPKKHKWAIEYRSGHFTDCMQQWWFLKQTRFDSLLFFKMGKFYELFYHDACIIQEICSLRWMGSERKPHVGFPERSIHTYAKACVERGYKVVVVEQTETPTQLESRIKKGNATIKAVERQVCEVITPGTIVRSEMLGAQSRPLLIINGSTEKINVGIVDVSMCKIRLTSLKFDIKDLLTLIYGINPAEIVVSKCLQQNEELAQCTAQIGIPIVFLEPPQDLELPSFKYSNAQEDFSEYNEALLMIKAYLTNVLLDKLLEYCTVAILDTDLKSKYMAMDAIAMSHLEIFKNQEGSEDLCLYSFLNRTSSAFGERRLRQWLLNPLQNTQVINQRSAAVELLIKNISLVLDYNQELQSIPDIERYMGKIVNAAANAYKGAIYFDESIFTKLHDLCVLLDSLINLENVVVAFFDNCKELELHGTILEVYIRTFTSVTQECNNLKEMIQVTGIRQCCSKSGYWEASDLIRVKIKQIELELQGVLDEIKKVVPNATFSHCKFRYEIEVTEKEYNILKKNQSPEITSTRTGFVRFRLNAIIKLVEQLENLEFELEQSEIRFFEHIIKQINFRFCLFTKLVDQAADLDCLCSFALVAKNAKMPMTRAVVHPKSNTPFLRMESLVHPMVYDLNSKFVPNDVFLNYGGITSLVLLTGPNMGGKSTLLRQTAIGIIMAQIGSMVPAKKCEFTVFDGIYTRLGSSDNIMQGQSTFLMELSDMSNMMANATVNSLCLIDELGRGTSTFDGTAIAASCLENIATMGARCIFTTHFKAVVESAELLENVTLCHMSYMFDKDNQALEFLYKLALGACAESHGYIVARYAGIPEHVIELAQQVGAKFKLGMSRIYKEGAELEEKIKSAYLSSDMEELKRIYNTYKHGQDL